MTDEPLPLATIKLTTTTGPKEIEGYHVDVKFHTPTVEVEGLLAIKRWINQTIDAHVGRITVLVAADGAVTPAAGPGVRKPPPVAKDTDWPARRMANMSGRTPWEAPE